jgi:hypothetical protein
MSNNRIIIDDRLCPKVHVFDQIFRYKLNKRTQRTNILVNSF